jgi:hypothetical protein
MQAFAKDAPLEWRAPMRLILAGAARSRWVGLAQVSNEESHLGTVQCGALLALKPFINCEFATSIASRGATLKALDPSELAVCNHRHCGLGGEAPSVWGCQRV